MECTLSVAATRTSHHDMALANRLAGESTSESSTIQKSPAVTDVMQSHSQQEMSIHHTYDYADPDICRQHTDTALKQLGNHKKDHPLLTSKQGKSTLHKHIQATM